MTSSLTCGILTGQTFSDFALQCARQMGALSHLQEPSAPISLRHIDTWRVAELQRSCHEFNATISASDIELELEIEKYCAKPCEHKRDAALAKQAKYSAMLKQVQAWQPPTEEHENFKTYMISLICERIDWECTRVIASFEAARERKKPTVQEYRRSKLEAIQENIEGNLHAIENEVQSCNEANEWILALTSSLTTQGAKDDE